ncbi:DUF397 domain-containing protein [Streptomyces scopuliridis]|uniref:DUF397 domain-containing protein n=1 Tax=Streptomyces scopuliridis TaxID=452529 RepID=UPI002DDC1179|nr:DUF397 domain-containing protein [Streptomyces scopuliridis]WSB33912.1 DUF397 domain-containing protein [Streptomyces scopuliridis]
MTEPIRVPEQAWRKSSYSGSNGGECIEVADGFAHEVPVRDSKNPTGPILITSNASWTAFVTFAKTATV